MSPALDALNLFGRFHLESEIVVLKIIALVFVCRGIGRIMRGKGRNPLLLQILTVVMWFGSGIVAGVAYGLFLAFNGQDIGDVSEKTGYILSLVCLVSSAGVAFGIAALIPTSEQHRSLNEYQERPDIPPQQDSGNPYNPYPDDPRNPFRHS